MKKDLTVTVGRKEYTLTRTQAWALVGGFVNFHLHGQYTQNGNRRAKKRAYLTHGRGRSTLRSGTIRVLAGLGLTVPSRTTWAPYYIPISDRGMTVAEALWPLMYPEEGKTWAEWFEQAKRENAEEEAQEAHLLKVALDGFKGVKDGDGNAITTRMKKVDLRRGFTINLGLEDMAAIGEHIAHQRSLSRLS